MSDKYSNRKDGMREAELSPLPHSNYPDDVVEEPYATAIVMDPKAGRNRGAHATDEAILADADWDGGAPKRRNCFLRAMSTAVTVVHKVVPPGGIMSSAFSLASGSIGAGILGLPGGTDASGLVLAVIYLVIITFFSVFSMYLLAVTTLKTNIETFEGLSRWLFPWGNYAFSYWTAFIRWFYSFGACVGYVISIGDCFKPIIAGALARNPDSKALIFFSTTPGLRLLQSLVWLCIMLPLVVPKHIDSLRHASTFAVSMMTYFVIVIIVHSCTNGLPKHSGNVRLSGRRNTGEEGDFIYLFRTGNDAITALGVFMFAYVCQINALEVWSDMAGDIRTPRHFTYAALIAMLICGTLYFLVCVFGYFDFGAAQLQSNSILLMYNPIAEPYMMVAYVGVMCKLCVSYALLGMAARNSIYYIIGWQQRYRAPRGTPARAAVENYPSGDSPSSCSGPAGAGAVAAKKTKRPKAFEEKAGAADVFVDNIPMWQHLIVVGILAVACLLCGLFIPNIRIVFGFAGAIAGGFLAFIFPALFHMYSGGFTIKQQGPFVYFTTYALLLTGVVGVIFGTGATIYSTAGGK